MSNAVAGIDGVKFILSMLALIPPAVYIYVGVVCVCMCFGGDWVLVFDGLVWDWWPKEVADDCVWYSHLTSWFGFPNHVLAR